MFSRNARVSARTVSGESAAWKVSSEIQPAYPVAASARNAAAYSERARPGRSDKAGMMAVHLVQMHVPDDVGVDRNQRLPGFTLVLGVVEVEHAGDPGTPDRSMIASRLVAEC